MNRNAPAPARRSYPTCSLGKTDRRPRHPLAGLARRASHRRGLTLVEICLVLALLVVISAISVPLMEGSFSQASLHSAGDFVRAAWAKARIAAMQSGQTYVFRFEPNGSRFQLLALSELGLPEASELQPESPDTRYDPIDVLRLTLNRLPEGVTFASGNVSNSSLLMATLPGATEGPWSPPVLFHPDGTTSDASVLLTNSRQRTIRVTLRGLTGISNMSEVGSEALQ